MLRTCTTVLTTLVACAQPAATTSSPTMKACVEPTGDPVRWAAAYCEYKNETDDFESDGVTACMNGLKTFATACEEKRFYKAEICKIAKPGDATCVDDASFVPKVVTDGVGG